jgi:hypothetical protein
MKYVYLLLLSLLSIETFSQDDLLEDLMKTQDSTTELLPKKMLLTQRVFWGEKGLLRPISPLTTFNREKELKLRRKMLVAHQIMGFVTLGGMFGQGIVGASLYKNPGKDGLKDLHEGLASVVNITYSTTAVMSLFAPPPLINRDKKISAIRIHKWLSIIHMSSMIATNILADKASDPKFKPYHRAAAYTAFGSFAAAVIAIKF